MWRKNSYFILWNYIEIDDSEQYAIFSNTTKSIVFEAINMQAEYLKYEVFIFEKKKLLGLYHPQLGVLVKPKFIKIYRKRTGKYQHSENLTLVNKRGKETTWILPQKVKDLYPMLDD